ncbi:DNA topoisomerase IV subunit B, partial [Desertibacillus haloalkaliphilus]|nr:DNA topoisomerase IV subunit B [Desertibacillus haloalkaliphilus]
LEVIGETEKRGTVIHFKPDAEIFQETTTYDFDTLATRLRELAFLNKGLTIVIEDKREDGKEAKYHYEGGIASFVEHLNRSKEVLHEEPIHIESEKDGLNVEVAVQY